MPTNPAFTMASGLYCLDRVSDRHLYLLKQFRLAPKSKFDATVTCCVSRPRRRVNVLIGSRQSPGPISGTPDAGFCA